MRFLISQDKDKIFLTFAAFDGDYIRYVTGIEEERPDQISFLQMQTFGPFQLAA